MKSSEYKNPLPACPDTPNCERLTVIFENDSSTVKDAVIKSLNRIGAHTVQNVTDTTVDAIFRIPVFGWKDDVAIQLQPEEENTVVFMRSASRVGHSDLGVNARRLRKLIGKLEQELTLHQN